MKKILSSILILFVLTGMSFARSFVTEFKINDIDEASTTTQYYGKQKALDDDWYIMKVTSSTVRYVQGQTETNYDIAWSSRTTVAYYDFDEIYANPFTP